MKKDALQLAKDGYYVFPLHNPTEEGCSCGLSKCGKTAGKHPRVKGWKDVASKDPEQIETWWERWPNANIGVRTGNGLVVIDIDDPDCEVARELLPMLPPTLGVRTGREGGMHRWYTCEQSTRLSVHQLRGVDIRADGGYIVAPPSLHKSGNLYTWVTIVTEPVELPDEVLAYLVTKIHQKKQTLRVASETGGQVPEGLRHDWMRQEIYKRVIGSTASKGEVLAVAEKYLSGHVQGEIPQEEINKLVDGAFYRKSKMGLSMDETTESGMAQKFIEYYGDELVYRSNGEWLKYNNGLWEQVFGPENLFTPVREMAYRVTVPKVEGDEDATKKLRKFYKESGAYNYAHAVTNFVKSMIRVEEQDFQTPDDLLPMQNGVVNMVNGEFREFRPEDRVIETINAAYDPEADCPLWAETIELVSGGSAEAVRFFQQMFGYLCGTRTMRGVFYWVGPRNTGKTTLINTLAWILGERLAGTAQLGLIHATRGMNEDEEMARACVALIGRRFVYMDETKKDTKVDESKFKRIASTGSILVARRLRQDAINFENKAKVVVLSNNQPNIDPDDSAAWDRVIYVPFLVPVPNGTRRESFRDELRAEASGIINWCLRGFRDWLDNGFVIPQQVREKIESWQKDENPLFQFIEDKCQFDSELRTTAAVVYNEYIEWHKEQSLGDEGKFKGRGSFMGVFKKLIADVSPDVNFEFKSNGKRYIKGLGTR